MSGIRRGRYGYEGLRVIPDSEWEKYEALHEARSEKGGRMGTVAS